MRLRGADVRFVLFLDFHTKKGALSPVRFPIA